MSSGYNLTAGGDKQIFSEETKKKISASKMGHFVSKETRKKLAAKSRKTWKLIFNTGEEVITQDLMQFCEDRNIRYNALVKGYFYSKKHKPSGIVRIENKES